MKEPTRVCDIAIGTKFRLRRESVHDDVYVKMDRGDILRDDGMKTYLHGLTHVYVVGVMTDEEMVKLNLKRHAWKPRDGAGPAPGERGPNKTKHLQQTDELEKHKNALKVLLKQMQEQSEENQNLRKILMHIARTLPTGESK